MTLKNLFAKPLALACCLAVSAFYTPVFAQEESNSPEAQTMFLAFVEKEGLNEKNAKLLESKVERILSRTQALASGLGTPFAVKAEILGIQNTKSEGLVRNVATSSAELVLTAINLRDGAVYYSVTTPLSATSNGSAQGLEQALVNSIKPNDAAYVRFVRNARKAIADYFTSNCQTILDEALAATLVDQHDMALALLRAVPPTAPCFAEALQMISKITAPSQQEPAPASEPKEEVNPEPETIEVPAEPASSEPEPEVETPRDEPQPEPDPTPQPTAKPIMEKPVIEKPQAPKPNLPEVYVSNPECQIKKISCKYLGSNRQILIEATAVFTPGCDYEVRCGLQQAYTEDGDRFSNFSNPGNNYYFKFPNSIPVKVKFNIDQVMQNPGNIAFVEFRLGSVSVEVRNLPVE